MNQNKTLKQNVKNLAKCLKFILSNENKFKMAIHAVEKANICFQMLQLIIQLEISVLINSYCEIYALPSLLGM